MAEPNQINCYIGVYILFAFIGQMVGWIIIIGGSVYQVGQCQYTFKMQALCIDKFGNLKPTETQQCPSLQQNDCSMVNILIILLFTSLACPLAFKLIGAIFYFGKKINWQRSSIIITSKLLLFFLCITHFWSGATEITAVILLNQLSNVQVSVATSGIFVLTGTVHFVKFGLILKMFRNVENCVAPNQQPDSLPQLQSEQLQTRTESVPSEQLPIFLQQELMIMGQRTNSQGRKRNDTGDKVKIPTYHTVYI